MRIFWLFCVLAIAAACSSDEAAKALAEACVINSDCNAPLVCAFRKCHQACIATRDCPPGQRCMASDRPFHVCQLASEKDCSFNSDCPERQICGIDRQCRDQCAATRDCLENQTCTAGACADNAELVDGGLAPAMSAEGGMASSGLSCSYNSECPGDLICRNQICSQECVSTSDCRAGTCVGGRCLTTGATAIGPAGGSVELAGGKVKLTIPAGALKTASAISILPLEAWPAGAIGPAFQITPNGLQFETAATLTVHYDDADLAGRSPEGLSIALAVGSRWTVIPSMLDVPSKTLTAKLAHLSTYGVVGPAMVDAGGGQGGAGGADASVGAGGAEASVDAGGADASVGAGGSGNGGSVGAGGSAGVGGSAGNGGSAGAAGSGIGGSAGVGGSTVIADSGTIPSCTVTCTNIDGCACHTNLFCNGDVYECVGTNGYSCECSINGTPIGKILPDIQCTPTILTNPGLNGCGFPFIVQ